MMYNHEFEITIGRKLDDYWPVSVRVNQPDGLASYLPEMKLELDMRKIRGTLKAKDYGTLLGKALFQASFLKPDSDGTTLRERLKEELGKIESNSNKKCLRILLSIDNAEDEDLTTLHWQKLCALIDSGVWSFLAKDQRVAFSMYIPTAISRNFPPLRQDQLRALVLIASPDDLPKGLSSFAVEDVISDLEQTFNEKGIDRTFLANTNGFDAPTLANLSQKFTEAAEKDKKPYTLLHIVSHGMLGTNSDITLFWADKDNKEKLVSGTELVEQLRDLALPHFAFLCACNSADPKAETAKPGETALGGLAQRLVRDLGMPAAIGMTRPVKINTALPLAKEFYSYLQASGEVDVALQASIKSAGLENRPDILTAPILFNRLGGRPLFISNDRLQELDEEQITQGIEQLDGLLKERAPNASVLRKDFEDWKKKVNNSDTRSQALNDLNNLCYQVLGITFDELASGTQPPEYHVECPFPGLSSFAKEEFHKFFFGRTELIDNLKKALNSDNNFLAVLGPSGSGKSSVVLAGLLPKLKEKDSTLHSTSMTPGDKPITRLKTKIDELEGQSSVLVVDQFEELFNLCSDKDIQQKFINQLLDFSQKQKVVITMRADFFGECALYENLKQKINKNSILIAPMTTKELGEVIQLQAQAANLRFEAGVNNDILAEVDKEPGIMPLLQFALEKLYERRRGNWLCEEEYEDIGRVQQAIATVADDYLKKSLENLELTPKEKKKLVKDIFLKLVHVDERHLEMSKENPKDTRKRVLLKDLEVIGDPSQIRQIVDELASERLIVKTGGISETEEKTKKEADVQIEVAHEALIQKWTRLKTWLNENRAELKLIQQIEKEAKDWHQPDNNQEDFLRLRGTLLGAAVDLQNKGKLNTDAVDYVKACEALSLRSHWQPVLRERAALVKNLLPTEPMEALVLAVATVGKNRQFPWGSNLLPPVQSSLFSAIQVAKESNQLKGTEGWFDSVAFSPDGTMIVTDGGYDSTILLWDLEGNPIGKPFEGTGKVKTVVFSPDSKTIVSGSEDGNVRLWDLKGNAIGEPFTGHEETVNSVAFSPDGKTIVSGSADKTVLWDLKGNSIGKPFTGHEEKVNSVAFSPDGKTIITGGSTIQLWDLKGNPIGKPFTENKWAINSVAFSPDGKTIVTGGRTIQLWNLDGKPIEENRRMPAFTGHKEEVNSVVFSPDGRTIVSGSHDGTIRLWDLEGNPIGEPLRGHGVYVTSVAVSPDGKTIASTGSHYDPVRLWTLEDNPIRKLEGFDGSVATVKVSPDGQTIVTSSYNARYANNPRLPFAADKTVRLWNCNGKPIVNPFADYSSEVYCVAFSPHGQKTVTGGRDQTVRLWDYQRNKIGNPFEGHQAPIRSVAFSGDGKTIVTGDEKGIVRLWDLKGNSVGKPMTGHESAVTSVAISPDGKTIISSDEDMTVRWWDRNGNSVGKPLEGKEHGASAIASSPDGEFIASGSVGGGKDKTVRLWNRKGEPVGKPFRGHEDSVSAVAFSPDGEFIASVSNKTVRLWDRDGNPMGNPFKGHSYVVSVTFSPDGKYIVSGGWGEVGLWPAADWSSWLQIACERLCKHPFLIQVDSETAKDANKTCFNTAQQSN